MEVLNKYYRVLDDGFISLKDVMGSDADIEQAARISYGKGTRKISDTRNLLRYLMRHKHTTPYEMVELKFHIRIPMDAWRQMIRHRTANVNEYSTRYSEAIDSQQKTDYKQWRLQSNNNKQGSSGFIEVWPEELITQAGDNITVHPGEYLSYCEKEFHAQATRLYEARLEFGIAKEQARKDLPLSTYTEAFWKIDLHNLFHYLRLRCDSHAQLEIRSYANVMSALVKEVCPLAWEAWYDYAFQAVNFTRLDRYLHNFIDNSYGDDECNIFGYIQNHQEDFTEVIKYAKDLGMSNREIDEFWLKISIPTEQDFNISNFEEIDYSKLYLKADNV